MTKFLETITFMGNDVLVPVDRIQYIMARCGEKGWEISIKGEGEFEWVEHFGDDDKKMLKRYNMIKHILEVKSETVIFEEMIKLKDKNK